jgi:hypothetical protein
MVPHVNEQQFNNNLTHEVEAAGGATFQSSIIRSATDLSKNNDENYDRIPIRLTGGRRAYVEVPTPLYESDKLRLKAQIDLLLADEDLDQ